MESPSNREEKIKQNIMLKSLAILYTLPVHDKILSESTDNIAS